MEGGYLTLSRPIKFTLDINTGDYGFWTWKVTTMGFVQVNKPSKEAGLWSKDRNVPGNKTQTHKQNNPTLELLLTFYKFFQNIILRISMVYN